MGVTAVRATGVLERWAHPCDSIRRRVVFRVGSRNWGGERTRLLVFLLLGLEVGVGRYVHNCNKE